MPFYIVRNDITRMHTDAVVNAAKPSLLGGAGVDGAIHEAAGPELLEACRALGGCPPGQARITAGFRLPAKYVIHTVGPVWNGGSSNELWILESCYRSCLELAQEAGCESVSFPLISAGNYGFPKDLALQVATESIAAFLETHDMAVFLVVYDRTSYQLSAERYGQISAFIDETYVEENNQRFGRNSENRPLYSEARPREEAPAANNQRGGVSDWFRLRSKKRARRKDSGPETHSAASMPAPPAPAPAVSAPRPAAAPEPEEALYDSAEDMLFGAGPAEDAAWKEQTLPLPDLSLHSETSLFSQEDLAQRLKTVDESFSQMLLRKIDEAGITDAQCYKKANIDRKLFSKIRKDVHYKPSKTTALAFAIALELSLPETRDMLAKAGFALSHSSKFDIIIEYFIAHHNYNIFEINETLFAFDQSLLGA